MQKFPSDVRPFSPDRNPHIAEHSVTEAAFPHIPPQSEQIDLRIRGDQGKPQRKRRRQKQEVDHPYDIFRRRIGKHGKCGAEYMGKAVLPTVRHGIHDKRHGQFSQNQKCGTYKRSQHFYVKRQKILLMQMVLFPKRQKHCRHSQNDKQKAENILYAAVLIVTCRTHGEKQAGRCLQLIQLRLCKRIAYGTVFRHI